MKRHWIAFLLATSPIVTTLDGCARRVPLPVSNAPTLTVTIRLPTGEEQRLGPVAIRPVSRPILPGAELPYEGSSNLTAVSLKPRYSASVVWVLTEGPGNPGPSLGLYAIPVGHPTDGPVSRFDVTRPPRETSVPCTARSAFLIDGVGPRPTGEILVWSREGERETSFRVERRHTLKLTPVLRFETGRLPLLAKSPEYFMAVDVSSGARDLLVLAAAQKRDRTWLAWTFPTSRGRNSWSLTTDESWQWRFYVLEDRPDQRSHCRGAE